MLPRPPAAGPLELLVVQPTPFCNINCSYCYLPDRQSPRRMSVRTLDRTLEWVFSSGLVGGPFALLWHAGEPLAMPRAFYEQAAALLARRNPDGPPVRQSFQTNATLIDAGWCEHFLRHDIHVGVSVDGPAFLHDRCRRDRRGRGTLERVLRGIAALRGHGIPFDVITVLTAESLAYPDELFDFYAANGIRSVGFNCEEIEGPHAASSLSAPDAAMRYRRFLGRFFDLALSADPPMSVREFDTAAEALLGPRCGAGLRTQENRPFAIVNVDCDGNFGTYSPELLGIPSPRHGGFVLGNVFSDRLEDVLAGERFGRLEAEIAAGVERCRSSCAYFPFCGGGAPANKHFENGTFDSTETLFCRLSKMACLDVTLAKLERGRGNPAAAPAATSPAAAGGPV